MKSMKLTQYSVVSTCDSIFFQFMAVFLNFKVTFMKFRKELNNFLLLHCSSGLNDHSIVTQRPKGKGR